MTPEVDYQQLVFAYRRARDQDAPRPARHPVVVVGAGPVGLALAIDLAQQHVPVVLLDNDDRLSSGSRAICFAKRTLEIFDRLGCGERMVAKGVSWSVGKVYFRDEQIYRFDLLPESGHGRPAFINLQQYYVEGYLAERAAELPLINLRWKNAVVGIEQRADHALLEVETQDGRYHLEAGYVAACDGSRSTLRKLLGQESKGRVFRDRFLIADVKMKADSPAPGRPKPGEALQAAALRDATPPRAVLAGAGRQGAAALGPLGGQRSGEAASLGADSPAPGRPKPGDALQAAALRDATPPRAVPAERWFWFDPPFHPNQSVLLHMQPDNVWRIDFQLGWDADPEREKQPEHIIPRVKALLGADAQFDLQWASIYTFSCLRMERFRHGRVLFAGDSAHGVSPFGARGANSGVQDAENLAWKLAHVVHGRAGDALLDSYAAEREYAADENIRNSTRATDFITPKSDISRMFRDATLDLAKAHPFARTLVNSGRLSVPATLHASPLNSPDTEAFDGRMVPGAPAADAPIDIDGKAGWLLRQLPDATFSALLFDGPDAASQVRELQAGADGIVPLAVLLVVKTGHKHALAGVHTLIDRDGLLAQRYDARHGTAYLLRPDQHVCARWRTPSAATTRSALKRALAQA